MGVDWYACDNCGTTFPDCGEYVYCACGRHWCDDECASEDGHIKEECSNDYDCDTCEREYCVDEGGSCNFCRKEDFTDEKLLEIALAELGVNREELVEKYRESED